MLCGHASLTFPPAGSCQRGFSLIELLVVIAIMAILAALLFPVAGGMQERVAAAKCSANLRQLGGRVFTWITENNGELPPARTGPSPLSYWIHYVAEFDYDNRTPRSPYVCTAVQKAIPEFIKSKIENPAQSVSTYGLNGLIFGYTITGNQFRIPYTNPLRTTPFRLVNIREPTKASLMADVAAFAYGDWSLGSDSSWFLFPHGGRQHFLFFDGHAELLERSQIPADRTDDFWIGGTY
jgi:prepilin-type N-terminal cleavage/methylation domain-containing protein/prepilin-type processing-associated H-X9-DG protein